MGAKQATEVTPIEPVEKEIHADEDVKLLEAPSPSRPTIKRRPSFLGTPKSLVPKVPERYSVIRRSSNSSAGGISYPLEEYDLQAVGTTDRRPMHDDMVNWFNRKNRETLRGSLAFVPWILQQSYFEGGLGEDTILVHRGYGAVVFSDASGFTTLTERLAKKSNGAELLSQCLTAFFTPLINLIHAYRGDVIKFSGDALMVYFPAVDDRRNLPDLMIPPHGSYDQPDLGPEATAALRASACCIEIQKRLHMFDTGVDGVRFSLHIGVGCGEVAILQVGGVVPPETHVPRCEYIISGQPLEQISIAEPLAQNGNTCLSSEAWQHVRDCVIEGPVLEDRPDYHLLQRLDDFKFTFPMIKHTALETDIRYSQQFRLSELNIIRRFIPAPVFKQIEGGTLFYANEMRHVSTMFISVSGVDVSTAAGSVVAQELMSNIQTCCYAHEGTLNKFLIDDKGMLFLLVYGLPPLVHTDDATRAVLSCFDMIKVFKRMKLVAKFGITSGRAYCGTCGSADRMEYTVLGDNVNLAARLMSKAAPNTAMCDESTKSSCTGEVSFSPLDSVRAKGIENMTVVFRPAPAVPTRPMGLGPDGRIWFPWYERPFGGYSAMSGGSSSSVMSGSSGLEAMMKNNVIQICSLRNWEGIKKIQRILGCNQFTREIHSMNTVVAKGQQHKDFFASIPEDSPFQAGGIIVIEGATGTGKIELAEHTIMYCACKLGILPVFGSMGPRVGAEERLGLELLRSTLGLYRHVDGSLPVDDLQCLVRVLPPDFSNSLDLVREALSPPHAKESPGDILLKGLLEVVVVLIQLLRKRIPILIVLQLEVGTTVFQKTMDCFNGFWDVVNQFHPIAVPDDTKEQSDLNPVVLMVLAKTADKNHKSVRAAIKKQWYLKTVGISETDTVDYLARYLGVPTHLVPIPLRQFITKITLGNVLYIREAIDQMLQQEHVKVQNDPATQTPAAVEHRQDLEGINIASWSRTAMVGETVCLLESLDPLEAAVVKMSTVFASTFTLPDLASSSCSHWSGATMFDQMRLFRAVKKLLDRSIIEELPPDLAYSKLPVYTMSNLLIRKVGASLILEAQRKSVKRQALIDRVLSRDLPEKMAEVRKKLMEPHVPWYYDNILDKNHHVDP